VEVRTAWLRQRSDEHCIAEILNTASDSSDDGEESDEVRFVMDSMAGNTEVPDSQECTGQLIRGVNWAPDSDDGEESDDVLVEGMVEVKDVALTLQQLASIEVSKFDAEKQLKNVKDLMLPVLLPQLYGEHNQQVIRAATDLLVGKRKLLLAEKKNKTARSIFVHVCVYSTSIGSILDLVRA